MSTYYNGRIVVFNENETKHKSFGEYDCFQFKEIDDKLMENYLNYSNREKWNPIISDLYGIKPDSDNEDTKRINANLINNAYILSTNDLKILREYYEEEKQKQEERIERLDETMHNQQSLASYQEFECELRASEEELSEINSKLWVLRNFEGMLGVLENCYEEEGFKESWNVLSAYLIIVRM